MRLHKMGRFLKQMFGFTTAGEAMLGGDGGPDPVAALSGRQARDITLEIPPSRLRVPDSMAFRLEPQSLAPHYLTCMQLLANEGLDWHGSLLRDYYSLVLRPQSEAAFLGVSRDDRSHSFLFSATPLPTAVP